MFFRKRKGIKTLLKEAGFWLRLAQKVHDYRVDVIPRKVLDALGEAVGGLERSVSERDEAAINDGVRNLEKILRKCGGCYYPRSGWAENVEMLLVAGILAIGIRTFFLQPFKIPTNSMYPTYNGLTHKVYFEKGDEPFLPERIFRFLAFGSSSRKVLAPSAGELLIPLVPEKEKPRIGGRFPTSRIRGRKWLLLPAFFKEATLYVGDDAVSLKLPYDFNYDKLIRERFFPESPGISQSKDFDQWLKGRIRAGMVARGKRGPFLRTGQFFKKGETILSFEIRTGDALFVDRFSYHFRRPRIGEPFVFRTRNIPGLISRHFGVPEDKYYIKRLVGSGGDALSVYDGTLFRNGKPIEGAEAFARNAKREGEYEGYSNRDRLSVGLTDFISVGSFYAMGDNSDESSDSRVWGFVPQREVVGKAFFIYFPFTHRWGPAD